MLHYSAAQLSKLLNWRVELVLCKSTSGTRARCWGPTETAEWFIDMGIIGPVESLWIFLNNQYGTRLTAKQCQELPSSKYHRRMMKCCPEDEFPDLLIVATTSMCPKDHSVIQRAKDLGRLVYVSTERGKICQIKRAVASLSEEDGIGSMPSSSITESGSRCTDMQPALPQFASICSERYNT